VDGVMQLSNRGKKGTYACYLSRHLWLSFITKSWLGILAGWVERARCCGVAYCAMYLSLACAGMKISGLLSLTCSSGYGLSSTRTISTPLQRDGEIEYHSSQNPESSSRLSRLIRNR